MKKLILFLCISAVAALSACTQTSDAELQKEVGDKIHAEQNLKTVSVMVTDRNVTLSGEVNSQIEQKLAESLAKQNVNVKNVENKIVIKSNGTSPMTTAPTSTMSESNSNMSNTNMANK